MNLLKGPSDFLMMLFFLSFETKGIAGTILRLLPALFSSSVLREWWNAYQSFAIIRILRVQILNALSKIGFTTVNVQTALEVWLLLTVRIDGEMQQCTLTYLIQLEILLARITQRAFWFL